MCGGYCAKLTNASPAFTSSTAVSGEADLSPARPPAFDWRCGPWDPMQGKGACNRSTFSSMNEAGAGASSLQAIPPKPGAIPGNYAEEASWVLVGGPSSE